MYSQTQQNKRSRYRSTDRGKNWCWSIPYHRMSILDDLEQNADMEMCSSLSQYLIRLVDKDTREKKKQIQEIEQTTFVSLFGEK